MTIEVLFAKASQGRTFLLMLLCGAALALCVQLAGGLYPRRRLLGMGVDLLCAAGLAAAMGQILLTSGEGLRLYGLLGLCIGALLYAAGPGVLVRRGMAWMARAAQTRRKDIHAPPPSVGGG